MAPKRSLAAPTTLSPRGHDHQLHVVIETPKGSRNKYAFNPTLGIFELRKVLPAGMVFPYDFGFVPRTRAGDGDPIDVLVLMDEPAFPGCLLACRLIGVIQGRQKDKGTRVRNDRLIAVERHHHDFANVRHVDDLPADFVRELEAFFVNYHQLDGEKFKVLGVGGPGSARRLLAQARKPRSGR
jgi:inorganic pyrophosphatase